MILHESGTLVWQHSEHSAASVTAWVTRVVIAYLHHTEARAVVPSQQAGLRVCR